MPADAALRDRLKAVRNDLSQARDQRAEAHKEVDAAQESFKGAIATLEDNSRLTEAPEFKAAEDAVRKRGTLDDKIADLRLAEQGLLQMMGDSSDIGSDLSGGSSGEPKRIAGWDGNRLVAEGTPWHLASKQGLFTSSNRFGTIQMGQIASRDEAVRFLSELPGAPAGPMTTSGAAGLVQPDFRGAIAPLLRPLRLLDLIPTGATDSNSIEYVQVTAIPNTVAPQAEGAVKAEVGMTLADATAPVRTIAGWIKVNRQAMDDAAGLATLINTLLPHDVRRKIEAQILNGDGTGQNLKGILQQTGLGAPAFVTGDNIADAILRAYTVVILSEGDPNFAALNPLAWQDLLLMRETGTGGTRAGQYLYGGPASMAAATVWGLTVVPTTAIANGAPLVGDTTGCTLLVREGVNVKSSDSDQDDFVRNRVTVLAEARVAFPVWRPSHFAVADTTP